MSDGAAVPDQEPEELSGPLPEPVRQRVVALASDTIGESSNDELPASLRPFARFAPARRARLAATPLAAALDADALFRHRVAARLRTQSPELAAAVAQGQPPPAADPLDVAVAAYLLRPTGWPDLVSAITERLDKETAASARNSEAKHAAKLREQLTEARAAARQDRDRLRAELATLKDENTTLRRTVKQARDRAREAEQKAATEAERADAEAERAIAEVTRMEAELRRLRARLTEAESVAESARRTAREGRDLAGIRLRLLLDTLVDTAQGLRRELALPPVQARPADTVEADEPATDNHFGTADAEASLSDLLALPQVHLIVDGYNVTKTAWPTLPLETQRVRLVTALGGLVAQTRNELTVVFDGADLDAAPPLSVPRGVRVRFSPAGVTADDVIRRLVAAEPSGRPVVVVSSDREIADSIRRAGARPVSASGLVRLISRG